MHIIKTTASIPTKFCTYIVKKANCVPACSRVTRDKDHQMPFVDGPNTRITNPRWRSAAILQKSKNRHISVAVCAIATKFGTMTQFDTVDASNATLAYNTQDNAAESCSAVIGLA